MKKVVIATAMSLSLISAYFSVTGMTTIFPKTKEVIFLLTITLEITKLITAYWLHQNWDTFKGFWKYYLSAAAVALALITSLGAYSFLQDSHIAKLAEVENGAKKDVAMIAVDLVSKQSEISDLETRINLTSQSIQKGVELTKKKNQIDTVGSTTEAKLKELQKLKQDREAELNALKKKQITGNIKSIQEIGELGPLKSIADLFGLDAAMTERIYTGFVIMLVLLIDPLAISLLLSADQQGPQNSPETEAEIVIKRKRRTFAEMQEANNMIEFPAHALTARGRPSKDSIKLKIPKHALVKFGRK